jgi:hypothetical protein
MKIGILLIVVSAAVWVSADSLPLSKAMWVALVRNFASMGKLKNCKFGSETTLNALYMGTKVVKDLKAEDSFPTEVKVECDRKFKFEEDAQTDKMTLTKTISPITIKVPDTNGDTAMRVDMSYRLVGGSMTFCPTFLVDDTADFFEEFMDDVLFSFMYLLNFMIEDLGDVKFDVRQAMKKINKEPYIDIGDFQLNDAKFDNSKEKVENFLKFKHSATPPQLRIEKMLSTYIQAKPSSLELHYYKLVPSPAKNEIPVPVNSELPQKGNSNPKSSPMKTDSPSPEASPNYEMGSVDILLIYNKERKEFCIVLRSGFLITTTLIASEIRPLILQQIFSVIMQYGVEYYRLIRWFYRSQINFQKPKLCENIKTIIDKLRTFRTISTQGGIEKISKPMEVVVTEVGNSVFVKTVFSGQGLSAPFERVRAFPSNSQYELLPLVIIHLFKVASDFGFLQGVVDLSDLLLNSLRNKSLIKDGDNKLLDYLTKTDLTNYLPIGMPHSFIIGKGIQLCDKNSDSWLKLSYSWKSAYEIIKNKYAVEAPVTQDTKKSSPDIKSSPKARGTKEALSDEATIARRRAMGERQSKGDLTWSSGRRLVKLTHLII